MFKDEHNYKKTNKDTKKLFAECCVNSESRLGSGRSGDERFPSEGVLRHGEEQALLRGRALAEPRLERGQPMLRHVILHDTKHDYYYGILYVCYVSFGLAQLGSDFAAGSCCGPIQVGEVFESGYGQSKGTPQKLSPWMSLATVLVGEVLVEELAILAAFVEGETHSRTSDSRTLAGKV